MVTPSQAKAFFAKYADACRACEPFIPSHVASVARCARWMASVDGLDPDQAEAAGWLHDIGYSTGTKDGHAAAGLEICREARLDLTPAQADAILNHGLGGNPTTDLGRLLKKADKLSLLDFDLVKACYPNGLQALKKIWLPGIAAVIPDEKAKD
jgi:putative nucleotidyltransferase with HDIG domain